MIHDNTVIFHIISKLLAYGAGKLGDARLMLSPGCKVISPVPTGLLPQSGTRRKYKRKLNVYQWVNQPRECKETMTQWVNALASLMHKMQTERVAHLILAPWTCSAAPECWFHCGAGSPKLRVFTLMYMIQWSKSKSMGQSGKPKCSLKSREGEQYGKEIKNVSWPYSFLHYRGEKPYALAIGTQNHHMQSPILFT